MAQGVKADAGITIGQIFENKYRVDSILGFGGMGVVAECTHLQLNERVAIKMLRQDVLLDQDAKARFLREAQAAVKLKSEYVARVSDVGTFDNGTPYMVMEYLEGHDLGEVLKQRGVLPAQWAVELMLQTAEALCEAHSLGIVHRDIKPTNLFVTWRPDGTALIKVLDFGISKSHAGTDMHLTQTQSLLGTPAYMSPEQMRSARLVDARTDVWSLGTVFYEALEGHRPFEAESFSEMCVKVAVDEPAPMRNTPPALQQVILRCLAKTPEQRYMSMGEFARDLVPFSSDPHSAQMLVERMARMLRRANMDWEGGSTGVGRQAIPGSVKDLGSGPIRGQQAQWGLGSDPAGNAWHGNTPQPHGQRTDQSQPFARPFAHDASQPFAVPLHDTSGVYSRATVQEPPKKSRVGLVLVLLGVLTAGAIAFGVVKATEEPGAESSAKETEPALTTPDVKMATGSSGSAAEVKPIETTIEPVKPDDVNAAASGSGSSAETKPDDKAAKPDDKKPDDKKPDDKKVKVGSGQVGVKTGVKTGAKTGTGTTKVNDKTVKTGAGSGSVAPVLEKVEPPKQPCDPFGAMHGCKK